MAKGRLSETLTPTEREDLARTCAESVVRAAHPLPVYVACSDADVVEWATHLGASIVHCPTPGLDNAVSTARAHLRDDGFDHVIVSHADLPLAHRLDHVARPNVVTMVADRHRDGTNVLSFPLDSTFHTAYGPGSLDNHIQIAIQCHLAYEVIQDESLELDLDTADDLEELHTRNNTSHTQRNPR
ncbi:MAG: hypothetical protein RIR69_475 [Actinomycetota bacterium]|jgi:2-phospho-L-lactate guanylyltransferase